MRVIFRINIMCHQTLDGQAVIGMDDGTVRNRRTTS
ncbi:MAG: hypothetical protein ACI8UG_000413 [Gammaproteobacteria bacterium]|jgi:hypothetical protein